MWWPSSHPSRAADRVHVSAEPIDLAALVAGVSHAGAGAVASFVGAVRDVNDGAAVLGIDYEAYGPMANRELAVILDEAAARWPGARLAVRHRVGYLAVGEASVAVAVSSPHRAAAFDACRYVVEELKRRVPVWKREHYADGRRAWVDGRVDPPRRRSPAEP
jgi:molybdopterin synthase catalytic subunit